MRGLRRKGDERDPFMIGLLALAFLIAGAALWFFGSWEARRSATFDRLSRPYLAHASWVRPVGCVAVDGEGKKYAPECAAEANCVHSREIMREYHLHHPCDAARGVAFRTMPPSCIVRAERFASLRTG